MNLKFVVLHLLFLAENVIFCLTTNEAAGVFFYCLTLWTRQYYTCFYVLFETFNVPFSLPHQYSIVHGKKEHLFMSVSKKQGHSGKVSHSHYILISIHSIQKILRWINNCIQHLFPDFIIFQFRHNFLDKILQFWYLIRDNVTVVSIGINGNNLTCILFQPSSPFLHLSATFTQYTFG